MLRAGREPAEDVKRRLVAACQEVGLVINNANMHLMQEHDVRWIDVGASLPNWPGETPTLSLMAKVGINGQWPDTVDVRCSGANGEPLGLGPWMKGRREVPFQELIEQLRETLEEREQVVAMAQAGIAGPYVFKQTVWDTIDLLGGMDLFGQL